MLRLNLDETSVKLIAPCAQGHIVRQRQHSESKLRHPATRRQLRTSLTFVATICDDTSIQPVLPQIILGSEKVLTLSMLRSVRPSLQSNVALLRSKNGWMTAGLLVHLVTVLGRKLAPFLKYFQPILIFDAYSAHLSPYVFRAAARAHIWTVVIPAKMTGLLQPLDTHVFYKLKMYLRRRWLETALQSDAGQVTMVDTIAATNDAVRCILEKYSWARAFEVNGFSLHGGHLRGRIREAIGCWDLHEWQNDHPLTLHQFQTIWPAGHRIPFADLFAWARDRVGISPRQQGSQASHEETPTQAPWLRRLRPRTTQCAEEPSGSGGHARSSTRPLDTPTSTGPRRQAAGLPRPIARSRPSLSMTAMPAAAEHGD